MSRQQNAGYNHSIKTANKSLGKCLEGRVRNQNCIREEI
jgi:hypothetical protein